MLMSPTKDERFYGAGLGARTKQTARFHGHGGTIGTMPTVMGLQGAEFGLHVIRDVNVDCASVHQPWQCSPGLAGLGDSGFVTWLREQNPVLAGAVVVGLSLATGLVLSLGTIAVVDAARGGPAPSKPLHGARRRTGAGTRLYHLVAINERTGRKSYLTRYPATHHEAVTMKSKFNPHRDVRIKLEQIR